MSEFLIFSALVVLLLAVYETRELFLMVMSPIVAVLIILLLYFSKEIESKPIRVHDWESVSRVFQIEQMP